jgi:hypothetical protein
MLSEKEIEQRLERALRRVAMGEPMSPDTFRRVSETIRSFRREMLLRHETFLPPLTAVALPSVGFVHVYRADLDRSQIKVVEQNLRRLFPEAPAEEITQALGEAFPDHRSALQ